MLAGDPAVEQTMLRKGFNTPRNMQEADAFIRQLIGKRSPYNLGIADSKLKNEMVEQAHELAKKLGKENDPVAVRNIGTNLVKQVQEAHKKDPKKIADLKGYLYQSLADREEKGDKRDGVRVPFGLVPHNPNKPFTWTEQRLEMRRRLMQITQNEGRHQADDHAGGRGGRRVDWRARDANAGILFDPFDRRSHQAADGVSNADLRQRVEFGCASRSD